MTAAENRASGPVRGAAGRPLPDDGRPKEKDGKQGQEGQRIRLVFTDDPYTKLGPGGLGTVVDVDDTGTLLVEWDSGSRLGLIPGRDRWVSVEPAS